MPVTAPVRVSQSLIEYFTRSTNLTQLPGYGIPSRPLGSASRASTAHLKPPHVTENPSRVETPSRLNRNAHEALSHHHEPASRTCK